MVGGLYWSSTVSPLSLFHYALGFLKGTQRGIALGKKNGLLDPCRGLQGFSLGEMLHWYNASLRQSTPREPCSSFTSC